MKKLASYLCSAIILVSLLTGCSAKDMQEISPDSVPETQVPESDPPRKDEEIPSVTESDITSPEKENSDISKEERQKM